MKYQNIYNTINLLFAPSADYNHGGLEALTNNNKHHIYTALFDQD